ncbi:MAG: threonylcarbamoyl-AMP synthase [Nitrospirae bacterium]|nr:threonylcarbamoyl-AMP synthase [Nitrospirota bacterium]
MPVEILKLDPAHADSSLKEAATLISQGKVIIYPTDTLYGIGAAIGNEAAVSKVFQIKKREFDKPILILIEKPVDLEPLVMDISSKALELMARYWPGPLTLVFKASEKVSSLLTGNSGNIGIRCSASGTVQRLLALTRSPLTATSANLSDETPVTSAAEAGRIFGDQVDLILDAGPLVSEPSTIIDVTGEKPRLIRQGKLFLE